MTPLSYFSFAWRILARDRLFTLAYGISTIILTAFFFLSVRIHINLYHGLSLSSIVSFDQTPQILFYMSLFSVTSLALFHSLHRLGDIGVMMAVGGNQFGCIWLQSLVLLILFLPASLLGFGFGAVIPYPATFSFGNEVHALLVGLACLLLICLLVSFITIGLSTFMDPYRAIRRQR